MVAKPLFTLIVVACAAGCAQVPVENSPIPMARDLPVQSPPQRTASQASVWERLPEMPVAIKPVPPEAMTYAESVETAAEPATRPGQRVGMPVRTVWDRIRNGFELAPMDNELVRDWENWYATRPDYVARMIDRSSRFLFHILDEVEKRRMPTEIALLPMIESAYNPVAYSKSHASGIWQFIPSTGKDYGLRQNWWYDGRRDVIAATTAALDYLEKLYGMFGDWPLALASYNWGEGSVSRAMDRNRAKGLPTDYESLTVPAETRGYLPKLIAVKNIIENPARFGLVIADVPNQPFFELVTLKRHIDLKLAARLADMSVPEFKFLNPGHNKPVIKAGEAERIVLPRDKVAVFRTNLQQHDTPLVSWQAVTLKVGQKPERIAAEHGMTLAELKEVNGLENQRKLVAGQPLLVPLKEGAVEPQLPDLPARPVTLPKAIQAAKTVAHARKLAHAARASTTVAMHKPSPRGVMRKALAAAHKPSQSQARAEEGKAVRTLGSKTRQGKQAQKSAPGVKVAARE